MVEYPGGYSIAGASGAEYPGGYSTAGASGAEYPGGYSIAGASVAEYPGGYSIAGASAVPARGRERKEGARLRAVAVGAALRGLSLASQSVRHLVSSTLRPELLLFE